MAWSFGQIRSWGNLTGTAGTDLLYFSGSGSITGSVKTSWPSGFKPALQNPLVSTGGRWWFDTAGYSAVPLDGPPELTYTVQLVAASGLSDDQAFHALRSIWEQVWNFVMVTPYTLDSVPNSSGQRGWLVVADERVGTTTLYKAKARCKVPGEFDLVAGEPHSLLFTLVFWPLSDFTAYTP